MIKPDKKHNFRRRSKPDGFTLIELLVAMAMFSVVMIVITDIFLSGMGNIQRSFGSQAVQESGRFILESMAKEIRMSEFNSVDGAIDFDSLSEGVNGPYSSLNITNDNGSVDYIFDNDAKQVSRQAGEILNPNDIEVTGHFYLTKKTNSPPRLTMVLNLISKSAKASGRAAINLQTTVSLRQYAP